MIVHDVQVNPVRPGCSSQCTCKYSIRTCPFSFAWIILSYGKPPYLVSIKIQQYISSQNFISFPIFRHHYDPGRCANHSLQAENSSFAVATTKKMLAFKSCNGRLPELDPIKLTAAMEREVCNVVRSKRTGISDCAFRVASLVTNQLLLRELCKHCCPLLSVASPIDSAVLEGDVSVLIERNSVHTNTIPTQIKDLHDM